MAWKFWQEAVFASRELLLLRRLGLEISRAFRLRGPNYLRSFSVDPGLQGTSSTGPVVGRSVDLYRPPVNRPSLL